jgi:hypothetical protein
MSENPFEVLRLGPEAGEAEAVRQAARLCQRAADEPARNAVRQAVQRLTASAQERQLYALMTHPRPDHASPELDRLVAAYRRPPAPVGEVPVPGVDPEEVRELLLGVLAEEQAPPALPLELVEAPEGEAEVARQTAEALWQGLMGDPRA